MTNHAINRCAIDEAGRRTYCNKMDAELASISSSLLNVEGRVHLLHRVYKPTYCAVDFCPFCGGSLVVPSVPEVPAT